MLHAKCYCPNCIYIKTRICTICLLWFFELQKFPSFLTVVALQSFNLSKISLDFFFFFERCIFSFTEVILWFFFPSVSECLSHIVELQCSGSEMLQSFSLITTHSPHGTPAIHLQQQKWVCLNTIYLPPFFSGFVVFQGYHFGSSEALLRTDIFLSGM